MREQLQEVRLKHAEIDKQRVLAERTLETRWMEQKEYVDSILTELGEVFIAGKVLRPPRKKVYEKGSLISDPNIDAGSIIAEASAEVASAHQEQTETQAVKSKYVLARVQLQAYERDLENCGWLFERQAEQRELKRAAGKQVETQLKFELRLLEMTRRYTQNFIKAEAAYEEAKAAALAGGVKLSDLGSGFPSNSEDGNLSSSDYETKAHRDRSVTPAWIAVLPEETLSPLEPCETPELDASSAKSVQICESRSMVADGRERKRTDKWETVAQ